MKLKTKLLLLAAFIMLAVPFMTTGYAGAATVYTTPSSPLTTFPGYNWTGAEHIANGGWTVPADTGHCYGAQSTDLAGTVAYDIPAITDYSTCESAAPAWVAAQGATACTTNGFAYSSRHGCTNNWAFNSQAAEDAYANHQCLYCHNGVSKRANDKSGYLKSAHANSTRPTNDGFAWQGSIEEGSPLYTADSKGNTFTWSAETISVSSVTKALYWLFGGWLEGNGHLTAIYGNAGDKGKSNAGCLYCHATGFEADATANTSLLPYSIYPSLASNQALDLSANDSTASRTKQTYGAWQQWGITCSRCHNATNGQHADGDAGRDKSLDLPTNGYPYAPATDGGVTAAQQNYVCYTCHHQNDGTNQLDTKVSDLGTQLASKGATVVAGVESHDNGYLNSPHAMFSGTYGDISNPANYGSGFLTEEGSCAACHSVHDSLTNNAADAKPWNNECGLSCHSQSPTDPYGKPLTGIDHPNTAGTPLDGVTVADPVEACKTCHMPSNLHIFRISTDASYSTTPSATQGETTGVCADSTGTVTSATSATTLHTGGYTDGCHECRLRGF